MASDSDRFLFDVQGFLLLEGALGPDEIAGYRDLVRHLERRDFDDSWMANAKGHGKPMATKDGAPPRVRLNGLPRLDPGFDALIDHPRVLPYLEDFMASPQLVNTWSITKATEASSHAWHRGMPPEAYSVRNGRIRSTMLNVVWFLDDNGPEDGCLVAVPGSHKNGIDLDLQAVPHHQMPGAQRVVGRAGDVFLMSESVLHDGARKTTSGLRTNLYFNYNSYGLRLAYDPPNHRHYCMPPEVRARFTAKQREVTSWMEHCLPVEAPEAQAKKGG